MNNNTILIIGLIILLCLYFCYQNTEYFTNNEPVEEGNEDQQVNNGNNNGNQQVNNNQEGSNNQEGNNGNGESNQNEGNGSNVIANIVGNNSNVEYVETNAENLNNNGPSSFIGDYDVEYGQQLNSSEVDIDERLDKPEMTLESVGNTKLIVHWRNKTPQNHDMIKFAINVYKCVGIVSDCEPEDMEKVTSYEEPNRSCLNCYMIIDDINMTENTYFIEMQIVYQNKETGNYIMTPKEIQSTKQEVEQNLDKMYKDALDHLIESNMQQKQINMEQSLQKQKIDNLRHKITDIKTKLKQSEKYGEKLNKILKPPYPIKTYYDTVDIFDPMTSPQQTINFDDKEYYIGLVTK